MKHSLVYFFFLSATVFLACRSGREAAGRQKAGVWQQISPFFQPPSHLSGQSGSYRSPLTFYDGRPVTSARAWRKRRAEILNRWHEMMGPWPTLITGQSLKIIKSERREDFVQHTVRFNWLPGEETQGYLLVPRASGPDSLRKRPAVITVFYEPETATGIGGRPYRDYAYQFVKRGFITLSLGTTEASRAETFSLYYPSIEDAKVQPLSMLAYAAANAWHALARYPLVDSSKIGIVGHSFGGKWAMFASCLFDKFACSAWSDPGIVFRNDRPSINYWEPWYLGYHPKPWRKRGLITDENPVYGLYPRLIAEGYDLHELHALMAPRPFLVSGGSEDPVERWIPLNHSVAVNKLLGFENRVAMTNRPDHSPDEESNKVLYLFFEYFLKSGNPGSMR